MKIFKKIMILLMLLQWQALQAQQWDHVDTSFSIIDTAGHFLRVKNPVAGNTESLLSAIASMSGSRLLNTFSLMRQDVDVIGNIHQRYQRRYNNIQVEGGMVILHCNPEGIVQTVNGDFNYAFDNSASVSISSESA